MIDVGEYLSKKGFNFTAQQRPKGIEYVMNCPFCEDTEKKFAINANSGAYKCFHLNKCGASGSITDFQRALGDEPERLRHINYSKPQKVNYTRPKKGVAKKINNGIEEWLAKRKITKEAIQSFKLGQKDQNTLMIPYFKDGELVNVKYRTISDKKMWNDKNTEPVLYNRDSVSGTELTICEGELDAIALAIYGVNAVSVPNGTSDLRWIENEWEWLEKFVKVNLIMDNDHAGQTAVKEIVSRLGEWRCFNVILPMKDANECLVNGIKPEEIISCIENAKDFDMNNLTDTASFISAVKKRHNNKTLGALTPFQKLDYLLKGLRPQELTVLSGNSGSGKSTIINQFILNLARAGHKSCIASLEMPAEAYLEWVVMQESYNGNIEDADIERVLTRLKDFFKIVDVDSELDAPALFDYWEFAAKKYGVKFFFLDSLMRINMEGRNEYAEQKKFVSDLLTFTKKHKCHIFLVAHPRKGETDQKTPGKVDVAGTANITNLAHNVLMLWRTSPEAKNKAEEKGEALSDAVLYLKKNRTYGLEGIVPLNFNYNTKLYKEVK